MKDQNKTQISKKIDSFKSFSSKKINEEKEVDFKHRAIKFLYNSDHNVREYILNKAGIENIDINCLPTGNDWNKFISWFEKNLTKSSHGVDIGDHFIEEDNRIIGTNLSRKYKSHYIVLGIDGNAIYLSHLGIYDINDCFDQFVLHKANVNN